MVVLRPGVLDLKTQTIVPTVCQHEKYIGDFSHALHLHIPCHMGTTGSRQHIGKGNRGQGAMDMAQNSLHLVTHSSLISSLYGF